MGTEPGGPDAAPACPLAAEGFERGLCSGPFHLKIKEQEKCFISSFSSLFFIPSSSPSPLFMAHKQPPSVEPFSSVPAPLLSPPRAPSLFILKHDSPADSGGRSGCSEPAFPAIPKGQGLGGIPKHPPPSAGHHPEIARISPRINQGSILSRLETWDGKLIRLIPASRSQVLKFFSLALCTLCLLNLPIMFLYKHQIERNLSCSYLHTSQKPRR